MNQPSGGSRESALAAAVLLPSRWREISALVDKYAREEDTDLPRLMFRAARLAAARDEIQLRTALRDIAAHVDGLIERQPRFAHLVAQWMRSAPPPAGTPPTSVSTHNVVGGGPAHTIVRGSVIQAGSVVGDLHVHAPPPTRSPAVVPRQLLPAPPGFTGRSRELAALERLVATADETAGGPTLLVISGPAGIGKTALVCHWMLGRAGFFPDGQLYADLRGHGEIGRATGDNNELPAAPGEILGQFLRALGAPEVPAELAEQAAMWRSFTAGSRVAVFLDNALSVAQVRPLLPGTAGSLVVVTSRRRMTGLAVDGAVLLTLGPLEPDQSVSLLTRRIGSERTGREPEAARAVALACGGLPLALCVVAARLSARPHHSLAALASTLAGSEGRNGVHALRVEGTPDVESALDGAYVRLPSDVARGYRLLALVPLPAVDRTATAAALVLGDAEADSLLDELAEASLLETHHTAEGPPSERYRFHDLIRAHAVRRAERHDSDDERRNTVRRVVDHYLWMATAAEELLSPAHRTLRRDYAFRSAASIPFEDVEGALRWLDEESVNLMTLQRAAVEHHWDDTAWQLADALWPFFLRKRSYDLWIEAHRVGLAAAQRVADPAAESRMLTSGGTGLRNAGLHDESVIWFTQAAELAGRTRDRRELAQSLHGLGQSHRLAGRLEEARTYFARALELRQGIGYRRGVALTLICLGDIAFSTGRAEEAYHLLGRARTELLTVQDGYDAARALAFLGRAAALAGHGRQAAERHLLQALDEFRNEGSVYWQAGTLEMLGETAEDCRDLAAARDHFQQSLALYRSVSERDARRVAARLDRLGSGPGDS